MFTHKKRGEYLRGEISVFKYVLTPSFKKNPDDHHPNFKPFSQEMHLKIPLSSPDLRLSNSKSGCGVSDLHFSVVVNWHLQKLWTEDVCFYWYQDHLRKKLMCAHSCPFIYSDRKDTMTPTK
jgi:hypothetical protein